MSEQLGAWPIDEPFPALLTDVDLMRVIGLGHSRFYLLKRRGQFKKLEALPQMTSTTRYSGHLVRQWVRGEWTEARSFGRRSA